MLTLDSFNPGSGTRKGHERRIQTVCRECTAGCGLWVFTQGDRVVDVQGDASHPVSRGRVCARGSAFAHRQLGHPERIARVLHRPNVKEALKALDGWESGLDLLADRLKQAKESYGAESLAVSCHMHGGSDFALGARRFARLWGTPHVYPQSHEAGNGAPVTVMASTRLPDSRWPGSGALFLVEADLASSHPVLLGRILEAQHRGVKVCAVDSQYTPTLAKADMSRMIRPDSGNWLGAALMKIFLEENHCSSSSMAGRFTDAGAWQASFGQMPSEAVLHATGVSLDHLRPMARFLARYSPVMVITGRRVGASRYSQIWPTLVTAMGWSDSPQGGWYPLTSGIADLNVTGDLRGGKTMETVSPPVGPRSNGWETAGKVLPGAAPRVLIFSGDVRSEPSFPFTPSLHEMDPVVYFGSRINPTEGLAHMVFPAATWPERDDLCCGENGTCQWAHRVAAPVEGTRTGLDFWAGLARRFGWENHFPWWAEDGRADLRAFYDWALQQSPWMRGVQVSTLEAGPCLMGIPDGSSASPPDRISPMPAPDENEFPGPPAGAEHFPLLLATPPDSGDGYSDPLVPSVKDRGIGENHVLIHPQTGRALAIQTGDRVVVRNDRASWHAKAWLTRTIPPWMVRSLDSGKTSQVLVHKLGEDPQRALAALKGMGL
jgi:anaerobic selenocysteine-containing dehydrogenase